MLPSSEWKKFNPIAPSTIVKADGTPKVMYHGTCLENGEFYVFDETKAAKKGGLLPLMAEENRGSAASSRSGRRSSAPRLDGSNLLWVCRKREIPKGVFLF